MGGMTLRRPIAWVLLMAALGGACSDGPTAPSAVDWQQTLRPGQVASVAGTGVSLRFDRVANDSRCPGDAICILGGDAIVLISVLEAASAVSYDLHTGFARPAQHHDITIDLVSLDPYPFSSLPFDPADYRATLRVTR
jgi:hypothetical protein